ncbi:MAG: hypothetical protein ACI915_004458 [Gammaproteobacteria bacterium]|jgi:hypothetical protein
MVSSYLLGVVRRRLEGQASGSLQRKNLEKRCRRNRGWSDSPAISARPLTHFTSFVRQELIAIFVAEKVLVDDNEVMDPTFKK